MDRTLDFLRKILTPEVLQKSQIDRVYLVLKEHRIFDRDPELRLEMAKNGKFGMSDLLFDLLAQNQFDLIQRGLASGKFPPRQFLKSDLAKQNSHWAAWLAAVLQSKDSHALEIFSTEPKAAEYPELFRKLIALVPYPHLLIQVLQKPQWKNHPELVDEVIKLINQEWKGQSYRQETIRTLIESENWKNHPRQDLWRKWGAINQVGENQCRFLF